MKITDIQKIKIFIAGKSEEISEKVKCFFRRINAKSPLYKSVFYLTLLISIPTLLLMIAVVNGIFDLRFTENRPSYLLLDRSFRFVAALENENGTYGFWKMADSLPDALRKATMAAEDKRFEKHIGVDFHAAMRAVVTNYVKHNGYSGASTIAMQVARLENRGKSGWYYKIHDAASAVCMTSFYGREKVLRQYFTIAPYGNRISGAACASRRYFRKPAEDLSLAEASLLAAIPKAPSRLNLFNESGFTAAKKRAVVIITRMYRYGWISERKMEETLSELKTFVKPQKEFRDESCYHFVNQCRKHLVSDDDMGGEIRTTIDLDLQDTVTAIIDREIPHLFDLYARNVAAMVVDISSGHVLSYIGSIDYDSPFGGAIDCAALKRSTGSLLKPFIYATGMEWQAYTSSTILTDLGFDFGSGRKSYIPENFDRKFQGPVLYKNALANSRNIPAVEVLKAVGVDMFYDKCITLGLTENDCLANYYGLGLSIGGLYCSLQQICEAYLCLADNGIRRKLVWTFAKEDSCYEKRQVIDSQIAMQIKRYLSDPDARLPSFPRGGNLEYPFAVAVKTGTSEGFRDSWCCAISDRYVVGVWAGNTDFSQTKNLSGYEGAAVIVKKIMMKLHPDRLEGLNDLEFSPPPGYKPVSICKLTGKLADRFTPYVTTEYFRPGTEPIEYSDVMQMLPVDKRNKLPVRAGCNAPVEYRRFIVLDPKYSEWARNQGLDVPPEIYSPFCPDNTVTEDYCLSITYPHSGNSFFIDPEMPSDMNVMRIKCSVSPVPHSVLWYVNGEESAVSEYPFTLMWKMQKGKFTFEAGIPGTQIRSAPVNIEIN